MDNKTLSYKNTISLNIKTVSQAALMFEKTIPEHIKNLESKIDEYLKHRDNSPIHNNRWEFNSNHVYATDLNVIRFNDHYRITADLDETKAGIKRLENDFYSLMEFNSETLFYKKYVEKEEDVLVNSLHKFENIANTFCISSNDHFIYIDKLTGTIDYVTNRINNFDYSIVDLSKLILPGIYKVDNDIYRVMYKKNATEPDFFILTQTAPNKKSYLKMPEAICKRLIGVNRLNDKQLSEYAKDTQFCAICGRKIEVRESIERGIGPQCFEKLNNIKALTDVWTGSAKLKSSINQSYSEEPTRIAYIPVDRETGEK